MFVFLPFQETESGNNSGQGHVNMDHDDSDDDVATQVVNLKKAGSKLALFCSSDSTMDHVNFIL